MCNSNDSNSIKKGEIVKKRVLTKVCVLLLIATFIVPSVLVQAEEPAFDWRQAEGETVTVATMVHAYFDALIPIMPEFEEMTGIKVEYDILPEAEFFEKALIDLSSGGGTYDVIISVPIETWRYVGAGWLEPLDSYMEDPTLTNPDWDFEDFYPSLSSAFRWNEVPGSGVGEGPLWGIPVNEESYCLFYRKDIFDAKGIEVPTSYEELYETAKQLDGIEWEGQKLTGFVARGNRTWPTVNSCYGTAFWTWGGEQFDEDLNCTINSPIGVEITDLWGKIMRETAPEDVIDFEWYQAQEYFAGGKAAMFIDADHMAEAFENPDKSQVAGKVGYALPPLGPNGELPRPNIFAFDLVMPESTTKKTAAWLWMQWATSKDALTKSAVKGNINPTRISVSNSPEMLDYIKDWGDYNEIYTTLLLEMCGQRWSPLKEQAEIGDRWALAVQEVILEAKTAQQALDDAAADIDKIIEEAGIKDILAEKKAAE